MREYRPDGVVKVMATLVSIAYFGLLSVGVLVLIAGPAAKLWAAGHPDWIWVLEVPATVTDTGVAVHTSWGVGRLVIGPVEGNVELPIGMLPWGVLALLWVHAAVLLGLMLVSLHQLRRIFGRVRDGVPFDASNAVRMRTLGLAVLAAALFDGLGEFLTGHWLKDGLSTGAIAVGSTPRFDLGTVFVAFVLVTLAEIFRRGAELEHEQSLVV